MKNIYFILFIFLFSCADKTLEENTVEEKPKTFIEKNSNLLIVGGIILGALLLTRK